MYRLFFFLLFTYSAVRAQNANEPVPIGQWREHLPYLSTTRLAVADNKLICATPYSFFTYNPEDRSVERFSRTSGLAQTGIATLAYDETTSRLLVAYGNSDLDLLTEQKIINVPDIRISTVSGDKTINNIFFNNQKAYLSTGIGLIVLDMIKAEVKDTYFLGAGGSSIRVNGCSADNTYLYAATSEGLKRAPINAANLADFNNWINISGLNGLSSGAVKDVFTLQGKLYTLKSDSIFSWSGNSWNLFYTATPSSITSVHAANGRIAICLINRVVFLQPDGSIDRIIPTNVSNMVFPQDALFFEGSYYTADFYVGLSRFTGTEFEKIVPNAPYNLAFGDMIMDGSQVWISAGAVNDAWNYTYNRSGIYQLNENNQWRIYNQDFGYPRWDTLFDFIALAQDQRSGNLFAGSFGGGLMELRKDGSYQIFKQGTGLQEAVGDPNNYRVGGLAFDVNGNLWISNYGAPNPLVVRKADSTWQRFSLPFLVSDNALGQLLVDDYNQIWVVSPKGNGLICYNYGTNIDNPSDDQWRFFRSGAGSGNLPDNNVFCVTKDKDGFIWVGTAKGIGVIGCGDRVFSADCNTVWPIVQQGAFAGYLFSSEEVRSIAVDGANRKWVATRNGVWLVSPDGTKVITRFTEDNSSLLSNDVRKIVVNPVTGEVFMLTFKGICSYRGTATEGGQQNQQVLVFPNPVPPGYQGQIAIRGLAANAIVKITELNGRLVFQTRANGGQAVWNGRNYRGEQVSSGVYLVLVADETNTEKAAARIVMIR